MPSLLFLAIAVMAFYTAKYYNADITRIWYLSAVFGGLAALLTIHIIGWVLPSSDYGLFPLILVFYHEFARRKKDAAGNGCETSDSNA